MTPKKPIIGITPSHNTENNDTSLRPTYPKAIATAGGLAILLPLECSNEDIKQFMDVCDGFLFTGGPDINPFLFGEDTHLKCGNISAARDHLEFRLLTAVMDAKKPVVYCGDLNVAHQEIDIKNPGPNRRNPGFTDEDRAALAEETPVERLGEPDEIARTMVFLADEASGYITGQVLGVNGGLVI